MVEKVKQSEQLDDGQKSEVLEKVIQEATAETRQQEEEMNQQQQEDDDDLDKLKQKLQSTKNMPRPENKD